MTVSVTFTDSPGWSVPVVAEENERSQLMGLVEMPALRVKEVGALPSFCTFTWMGVGLPGVSDLVSLSISTEPS